MNSPGFHERGHAWKQGTEIPEASRCSQGCVLSKEHSFLKKNKTFRIDVVQHHRHIAYALGSNIEKEKKWQKKIASNRRETKNNPKHVRMPRRKLWKQHPRDSEIFFPLLIILILLPGPWHSSCGFSEKFFGLFGTDLGNKYQQRADRE